MKTFISILFFISSYFYGECQITTPIDSLIGSLKSHHDSIVSAHVHEFKNSNNLNWLYFVPGIGYDFISNRPMISYSLTHVAQYLKTREQQKNKTTSIQKTEKIDFESDVLKLRFLYSDINNRIGQFATDTMIVFKHKQLFEIYKAKFLNNEIMVENYIMYEIALLEKQKALAATKNSILNLISNLEELSNAMVQYKM